MGWAKYEEDNREARNDRWSSGNYFWTPYQSQEDRKSDYYFGYYKTETIRLPQVKQTHKKNTYAYGY